MRCGRHMADCTDSFCPTHGTSQKHTIFVYGTLRPGEPGAFQIPGTLYDLGWYPGIILGGESFVTVERIEVDDLAPVDAYEGYNPNDTINSLYIRKEIRGPDGTPGFIYEYNQEFNPNRLVQSGDWLDYISARDGRLTERGTNGGRFC